MKKYRVVLSSAERNALENYISDEKHSIQSRARAMVLLDLDECDGERKWTLDKIASRNGVSKVTVWNVCKKYIAGGVKQVLERKTGFHSEEHGGSKLEIEQQPPS